MLDKRIEQFLDAEVVDCGTEKYGRLRTVEIARNVKTGARPLDEFDFLAQLRSHSAQRFLGRV